MAILLAGRGNIRSRRLHRRFKNRLQSTGAFGPVQMRIADHRTPGPYRVEAETEPGVFLDDDTFPVTTARIEIGFEVAVQSGTDSYWVNWIEPERNFLLGWHQDQDHPDLGPVHIQVTQYTNTVDRTGAAYIDDHPMAVLEARLDQLPDALASVQWDGDTVSGIEW